MGITIPEHESELCAKLMRPAWIAAGLTNDLFSWEKEYEAAVKNGQANVSNAIWVLMGEHSITTEEAKTICRQKIKEAVAEYVEIVKLSRNDTSISLDLRRYIEAMQYSLSGNVIWSLSCPRYHPELEYNQLQLLRMKHGLNAYPGPYLGLKLKRVPDSASYQDSEQLRKRVKTSTGLSTPPSPAPNSQSAVSAEAGFGGEALKLPRNFNLTKDAHVAEYPVVSLQLPELGEEVCEIILSNDYSAANCPVL